MDNPREKIIIAARHIFAKSSYAKATISEIATEANVARGSLHYHFKNKEDLFVQVMRSIYDESLGPMMLSKIEVLDANQLAAVIVSFLREALKSTPDFFNIIYESLSVIRQSEHVREALVHFWDGYRRDTEKIIEELKGKGVIVSSIPSGAMVILLVSLLHGFAIQAIAEPELIEMEENWAALEVSLIHLFEK